MDTKNHPNAAIVAIFLAMALLIGIYGCEPEPDPVPPPVTPGPTVLDEPGEYTVATLDTEMENDNGSYSVTIYFPGDGTGQYPAISFSPGLGASKNMYHWVGNHLASHGYAVLIFTVPKRFTLKTAQHEAGFASAFELLEAQNSNPDSLLYGHVDLSKRAIMGHSLGGLASLRAAATMPVDAVIALAPAPGLENESQIEVQAPAQIQTATLDCITGEELADLYYQLLTYDTKQIIDINGGNHVAFNDAGSIIGERFFDCASVIDTANHHQRLSRRYFTAWLDYFVKGDGAVESYLFGENAEQDLLSELLTILEFVKP